MVGQFQRRLRNCHLHSFMAVCSPAAMACKMPGFCRISRRWRRLSRARLGSRTNCTFLELVRRLDEEATLTIPLAQHKDKGNQSQGAGSLCMFLLLWPSKLSNWCVLASHGCLCFQNYSFHDVEQWHMLFQDHEQTASLWVKMQVSGLANNMKLYLYLFIIIILKALPGMGIGYKWCDWIIVKQLSVYCIFIKNLMKLLVGSEPDTITCYYYIWYHTLLLNIRHLSYSHQDKDSISPNEMQNPSRLARSQVCICVSFIFSIPCDKPKAWTKEGPNMSVLSVCPKSPNSKPLYISFVCCKCQMLSVAHFKNSYSIGHTLHHE